MLKQYYHTVDKQGSPTPVIGNAVICGYSSINQGGACGMTTTVWVEPPNTDIVQGITVYTNRFLTQTLQGQAFIRDSTGVLYEISSLGVVGAATGNIC